MDKTTLSDLQAQLVDADVALAKLRAEYDAACADALLSGAPEPTPPKPLTAAEAKVRQLSQAVAKLGEQMAVEAESARQAKLVAVRAELAAIHAKRQSAIDLATAVAHLSHRLFAVSTGNAVGGGAFHSRIQHCAIMSDWPKPVFGEPLKVVTAALIELGITPAAAGREVKSLAADCPVQRDSVRSLSNKLLALLIAENLVTADLLKPIN